MSWYSRSSKMWESYCRAAELELGGGGGTAKVCRVSVTFGDVTVTTTTTQRRHSRSGWGPPPPGANVAHRSLSPRLACKHETEPHSGGKAVLFLRDQSIMGICQQCPLEVNYPKCPQVCVSEPSHPQQTSQGFINLAMYPSTGEPRSAPPELRVALVL